LFSFGESNPARAYLDYEYAIAETSINIPRANTSDLNTPFKKNQTSN